MKLTADNSLPLYVKLTNQLRKDIENGNYQKGEKIPTEQELCKIYNVSRITVRNALKALSKERLLVRLQGKGTYVANEKFKRDISRSSSFTQICLETGQIPGAKVVKCIIEDANPLDIKELNLKPDDKVIALERIRYANNIPVAFEISRFPESFSFLLQEELNNSSLINVLTKKHNIILGYCTKCIELVYASYELSHYLEINEGYPLISIISLTCDSENKPIHRSLQYVVGDKFKFYIN